MYSPFRNMKPERGMIVKLTREFTERVMPVVWASEELKFKYERPWLVVQNDVQNKYSATTLLVYLTTVPPKNPKWEFMSRLPKKPNEKETWANCTNIVCVESGKDIEWLCDVRLKPLMGEMADIDRALRNALGLK